MDVSKMDKDQCKDRAADLREEILDLSSRILDAIMDGNNVLHQDLIGKRLLVEEQWESCLDRLRELGPKKNVRYAVVRLEVEADENIDSIDVVRTARCVFNSTVPGGSVIKSEIMLVSNHSPI